MQRVKTLEEAWINYVETTAKRGPISSENYTIMQEAYCCGVMGALVTTAGTLAKASAEQDGDLTGVQIVDIFNAALVTASAKMSENEKRKQ